MNSLTIYLTSGDFDYMPPETNNRRYFILEEGNLNSRLQAPAPNALQLLLNDDVLASSCQSLGQYRSILAKKLTEIYSPTPTTISIGKPHTDCRLTAPVTASGRAFGLIPEGKGWADDLINWSTREFRNPADAVRLQACWNAFDGVHINDILAAQSGKGGAA